MLFSYIYQPKLSAQAVCDTRSIFKQSLTGLNSKFSISSTSFYTNVKELSLPYYLSIAGSRIVEFLYFQKVLALLSYKNAYISFPNLEWYLIFQ